MQDPHGPFIETRTRAGSLQTHEGELEMFTRFKNEFETTGFGEALAAPMPRIVAGTNGDDFLLITDPTPTLVLGYGGADTISFSVTPITLPMPDRATTPSTSMAAVMSPQTAAAATTSSG